MDQIPSHMRTGFGAHENRDETWLDEFMFKVHISLRALVEDVTTTAVTYAQKAGRDVAVDRDFQYALMWESRRFATRPDLERRIEDTYETTMQELAQVFPETYDSGSDAETGSSKENGEEGDSDTESDTESDTGTDTGTDEELSADEEADPTLVPPEESPPFTRATDKADPFVRAIHEAVDTWDQWNPDDPIERMFKDAIDRIDVSHWHIPSSSDIEEEDSDGESG